MLLTKQRLSHLELSRDCLRDGSDKVFVTYTLPIWGVVSNNLFSFLLLLLFLGLIDQQHLFLSRNQQGVGVDSGELVGIGRGLASQDPGRSCGDKFLVLSKLW